MWSPSLNSKINGPTARFQKKHSGSWKTLSAGFFTGLELNFSLKEIIRHFSGYNSLKIVRNCLFCGECLLYDWRLQVKNASNKFKSEASIQKCIHL